MIVVFVILGGLLWLISLLLLAFSAITGRCVDSPISRRRRRSDEAGRESNPAAAPSTDHPREDVHED